MTTANSPRSGNRLLSALFTALAAAAFSCSFFFGFRVPFARLSKFGKEYVIAVVFAGAAALFLAGLIAYLRERAVSPVRPILFSLIPGFILAVSTSMGILIYESGTTAYWNPSIFPEILLKMPFFMGISLFFICFRARGRKPSSAPAGAESGEAETAAKAPAKTPLLKRLPVFLGFVLIFTVVLLAAWPGLFSFDAPWEYYFATEGQLTSHHPVLHEFLIAGLMNLSYALFKAPDAGVLTYAILQILFLSLAFERAVMFVAEKSRILAVLLFLLLALIPAHGVMAVSVTKDPVFAGWLVCLLVALLRGVEREKWRAVDIIHLVLILFFMCAFRNTGIYMTVVLIPIALIVYKKHRKPLAIAFAGFIALWTLYTVPVYRLLNVEPASPAEMLSVPIQQLSVSHVQGDITPEEREQILRYIPTAGDYYPFMADQTKISFDEELFAQDRMAFFKLWLKVFPRNKGLYLNAFLIENTGMWQPRAQVTTIFWYYFNFNTSMFADYDYLTTVDVKPVFPGLYDFLTDVYEDNAEDNYPLLSLLSDNGVWFILLVMILTRFLYKKDGRSLTASVPLLVYFGICLLGPAALYRYGFPIAVSTLFLTFFGLAPNETAPEIPRE